MRRWEPDPSSDCLRRPVGHLAGIPRTLLAMFHDAGPSLIIWCQWNTASVPVIVNPTRRQVLALIEAIGE